MNSLLPLLLSGMTLGFTAGVLPGGFKAYILNTTLVLGWRYSLIIIVSPLIVDTPLILLVVFVLQQFPPEFIQAVQIIGGAYILWLAWSGWRNLDANMRLITVDRAREVTKIEPRQSRLAILQRGLLLNVLSPGPYIFWSTVTGPLLIQGLEESVLWGGAFLLSFYGVFLGMMSLEIFIFDRLRRLNPRIIRLLLLATLALLTFFGFSLLLRGLGLMGS